ncbi:glycosyltransferase involved in cell wall biosynthesis [Kibdelosporangium banguiense]|uniref:4,4'-diaponeurosporenoate glycosyltransferase n=1 Tax=Kibdelosporangium banguiense TaxID=1365924 RepID=A0ABS4TCV5_9PSEU|nr:glycosyltransferase family 2 protein [Kibdelosporangium banguiense]MBP2322252.1 glycosyltransferase involved in cell wall biosynthesis [Kibdelosporangium banguiense]
MGEPIVSVVIAAHEEQAVIARCLRSLTAGAKPGELDIVVVANACTDRTAQIARSERARVIETPIPGKAHALVLGDAECRTFPRLYLDADVDLDMPSLRLMLKAIDRGALACSPVPEYDMTGVSRVAARFNRVHDQLLSGRRGLSGAGAYLLSKEGHTRVFPLPVVISDDGFVHRAFSVSERQSVAGARSVVRPARTVRAVIRRRARVRLGNRELDLLGRKAEEAPVGLRSLVTLVRRGQVRVLDALWFLVVLLADKVVARWRRLRGKDKKWASDTGSR